MTARLLSPTVRCKEQDLQFHFVDEDGLSRTLPQEMQNLSAVLANADEEPDWERKATVDDRSELARVSLLSHPLIKKI